MNDALARFHEYRPLAIAVARSVSDRCATYLREDVCAASIAALWIAIQDQAEHPNLKAYVRIRCRGAAFDELRRHDWSSRRMRTDGTAPTFAPLDEWDPYLAGEGPSPETLVAHAEQLDLARAALSKLTRREQAVVEHISAGNPQRALAHSRGVTDCAVTQMRTKAVRKIAAYVRGNQ